MRVCVFDIETPFIPKEGIYDIKEIFCIGIKINNEEVKIFSDYVEPYIDGTLQESLELMNSSDLIVGHNIAKFDIPIIENILGKVEPKLFDTFIAAKLMYSKDHMFNIDRGIKNFPKHLMGKYSLDAFGQRIGNYKLDFEDFSKISEEMVIYCKQDVEVTKLLYESLIKQDNCPPDFLMKLECDVGKIVSRQEAVGFYIDLKKTRDLFLSMKFERDNLYRELLKVFKPKFLKDGHPITPAATRRAKIYTPNENYQFKSRVPYRRINQLQRTKDGKWKLPGKNKYKYFTTPHKLHYSYTVGEYQKIKLEKFNPGSRQKITYWLKEDYGYEFPYYTPTGAPKVDVDSLEGLDIKQGVMLKKFLKLSKDLSQLESGTGSLLNNVREDSTLPTKIDTNGTITGRFTSSSVNLNQLPTQKEFRELFVSPEGWNFVGADFSQQELINLAELLYPYDNGQYYETIISGDSSKGTDIHSVNANILGVSRNDGKAVTFGFLYGSSETLTGYTILKGKDPYTDYTEEEHSKAMEKLLKRKVTINGIDLYPIQKDFYIPFTEELGMYMLYGRKLQQKLIEGTQGLRDLISDLTDKVSTLGYATTVLGRRIPVESNHVALNYHAQGMGAEAMKVFLTIVNEQLSYLNPFTQYRHQATIYDEVDYIVKEEYTDYLVEVLKNAFPETSKRIGMKCQYSGDVMIGKNWWECH